MQFQYNIRGYIVYSRSPYGALMYARSLFREYLCVHDVLDGEQDAELNYEDRPTTRVLEDGKTHSSNRYWDYKHRRLCDNLKDVCGRWYHELSGCIC